MVSSFQLEQMIGYAEMHVDALSSVGAYQLAANEEARLSEMRHKLSHFRRTMSKAGEEDSTAPAPK